MHRSGLVLFLGLLLGIQNTLSRYLLVEIETGSPYGGGEHMEPLDDIITEEPYGGQITEVPYGSAEPDVEEGSKEEGPYEKPPYEKEDEADVLCMRRNAYGKCMDVEEGSKEKGPYEKPPYEKEEEAEGEPEEPGYEPLEKPKPSGKFHPKPKPFGKLRDGTGGAKGMRRGSGNKN
jgi:hypothetical protein